MDKIWYRNPSKSELIGRCGRDEKKQLTTQADKSRNAKYLKKMKKIKNNDNKYIMNKSVLINRINVLWLFFCHDCYGQNNCLFFNLNNQPI